MARHTAIVLVLSILMTAPIVAAAFNGKGAHEPDTPQDVASSYMRLTPDGTGATKSVYFNGFVTDGTAVITSENPNLGTIGSATQTPQSLPFAMLGVWKDCNHDGYIGNGDAEYIYRFEQGFDASICPQTPGVYPTHNDGVWVYEFNPITWSNDTLRPDGTHVNAASGDINAYRDNEALVWVDDGLPTDVVPSPLLSCSLGGAGAAYSTGRLLSQVDCFDNNAATHAFNDAGAPANGLGLGQVTFSDVSDGRQGNSSSKLNVFTWQKQLGDSNDDSYVEAWDCSQGADYVNVTDPTGGAQLADLPVLGPQSLHRQTIPGVVIFTPSDNNNNYFSTQQNVHPGSGSTNTGGSVAGTLNQTDAGSDCDPQRGTNGDTAECPTTLICDAPLRPAAPLGKTRPSQQMVSAQWPHKYGLVSSSDAANDLSDKQGEIVGADFRQYWYSNGAIANNGPVNRETVVQSAHFWSYYGLVSSSAVSRFGLNLVAGSSVGTYGQEACAASALDGLPRFDCDATHWWKNADGTDAGVPSTGASRQCWDEVSHCDPRTRVGQSYNLRDTDCFDQMIAATRAVAQTQGLGCPKVS